MMSLAEITAMCRHELKDFDPPKRKVPVPVRMRCISTGKYVLLPNGKHIWRAAGHAKSALKNHIASVLQMTQFKRSIRIPHNIDEIYDEVLKDIEIVPVPPEEIADWKP